LVLLAATAGPAVAQRAGIAAGATYSSVRGDFLSSSSYEWGFVGGGYMEWQFQETTSAQIELNYAQRGGGGTLAATGEAMSLSVNYLEIPLRVNLIIPAGESFEFRGNLGFQLGIALNCKGTVGSATEQSCGTGISFTEEEAIQWTVPLTAGFGYNFGDSKVILEARYNYGLNNVLKGVNIKNRSWDFVLRFGQAF
jgi:hypothetical protein